MSHSSETELVLFALASLGVVLSSLTVLRMMRSRAVIANKSHRN